MIPTTQVRISKIAEELGIVGTPVRFTNLFSLNKINKYGLNSNYCAGGTADLRLTNITTRPFSIGKFRGYRHGLVYLLVSPNKLYYYDFEDGTYTYIADLTLGGGTDLAMTDNRLFYCYDTNPVKISEYFYDLRFPSTINHSRTFNTPLNSAAGMFAVDNNTIVIGGSGSIKVLDISGSTPVEINSIPISGEVTGDIICHPSNDTMVVTITYAGAQYIRKYNYVTGQLIVSGSANVVFGTIYAMFSWRNVAYAIRTDGAIYSINPMTMFPTYVKTILGLGAAVNGACNTVFGNNNF